ncbi:MAG: phosphoribosylaminoimidazolesuccinocarboxamide synthase [Bdellovibrionales bacterium]|nr:phosphoribosylaminoimidazolesuccinocarboxamide synthase [Bdellovibrionales bacterium]
MGTNTDELNNKYSRGNLLYEGKAKKIFNLKNRNDLVWVEYKDSLTAFNAQKRGSFLGKGALNRNLTALIYKYLGLKQIKHHLIASIESESLICHRVKIIPLEVVVRNRLAGSTAKKFKLNEGAPLKKPLVEFFYKSDELEDPFVSDDQALMLQIVETQEQLELIKAKALEVNKHLRDMFAAVGIELIDFKIEYGKNSQGELILADEITPDCCRLWDFKTGEKLDKDRFRRDLGNVEEKYLEVWNRLKDRWEKESI